MCGRASSSRSSSPTRDPANGEGARHRDGRQAAGQPGDRKLSRRGPAMKFSVVVFPGSNSDYDAFYAASRVIGEQAELDLAQGHRPQGRRRRDSARRVRPRRLPAHRRDRALLADHARGARRSPIAAARCSASATASRCCSKPACCPARWSATIASSSCRSIVPVRVEQTDTPFTAACASKQVLQHADRARRRQLLRRARCARASSKRTAR